MKIESSNGAKKPRVSVMSVGLQLCFAGFLLLFLAADGKYCIILHCGKDSIFSQQFSEREVKPLYAEFLLLLSSFSSFFSDCLEMSCAGDVGVYHVGHPINVYQELL